MHAVNDKKAGSRHIFGFCATKTMQFLTATLLYLVSHLSLHKLFQTNTKIFTDDAKLEENSHNCTLQMRNLSMSIFKQITAFVSLGHIILFFNLT
jgi:hypothetical protein